MKVLYIDYNMYGKKEIIQAFKMLGNEVDMVDHPLRFGEDSEKTKDELYKTLEKGEYDIVFTSNYYSMVSDLCSRFNIKYISWTYDSPRISLYDPSILNECNYAFTFDSNECKDLRSRGVDTIYYMPLAVATDNIAELVISENDKKNFCSQVSLVASLYNEEHNLYDRLAQRTDDYTRGYLDAVVNAQSNLFGGNILEEVLGNKNILSAIYNAMPYKLSKGSLADNEYVYANYFLCRRVATVQRKRFIREISGRYDMKVYTPGDISDISTAKHMGTVDYNTDMYKVFMLSKINLNVTLPSIKSGIPLRAMDIMGAGGFLLTNYQQDFEGLFEPDYEYVFYTSIQDALLKIEYYLQHEDERLMIAENGKKKIDQCFTYYNRIEEILSIVSGVE